MTRLPVKPAIPPEHVTLFIDQVVDQFQVVSLNAHEYAKVIHTAGEGGITGGRIYDALLLQCARKSAAEAIYTWNLRHFTAIAPDLADRIQTP